MGTTDCVGYLASFLVFCTFYTRRMVPLRLLAVASNLAFIGYAWLDGLTPILVLHCVLLPLNILRLLERRRLVASDGDTPREEGRAEAALRDDPPFGEVQSRTHWRIP